MRARAGFTLLEAAVAIAIVGIISIAALSAFSADLRAAQRAQELLPASALAQERMAALELADPTQLSTLPDSLLRGRFSAPFERYEWTAFAASALFYGPGCPAPGGAQRWLYDFNVHVRWADGDYSLDGRRFRPPPTGMAP
jgi:prepilin-type N-terminal cleavage/methylation domain-containing protein